MPYGLPPSAQQPGGGSGFKILGGCGIAGCLGLFVAGIAIVLAVVLFRSSSSSASGSPSSPSEAPSSGALKDMVRQQIGVFRLIEVVGRPTNLPSELTSGAVDSLAMNYAGNGGQVGHVMFAFASSSVSAARLANFKCSVTTKEVKNHDGKHLGTLCVNQSADGSHIAMWTNGSLLFLAAGSPSNTAEFYNNVPY